MIQFLNDIIDKGEDLLLNYDNITYEGIQEDIYLEVITKSRLFFKKLKDDPLELSRLIEDQNFDQFCPKNLKTVLKTLKKAFCYFEVPENDPDTFWNELHPLIRGISKPRFDQNFYADAVETAFKEVNNIIKTAYKQQTGVEIDGAALMQRAFSVQNPVFVFDTLETETGKSIQQGYMQIFSGAMIGIRNPKAHNNMNPDRRKTIHLLFVASFMAVKLEDLGLL